MKRLLVFVLLVILKTAAAQEREATIIFDDSTSVEGLGQIKKNIIYFRVDNKSKVSEWSADSVKGISFSGHGFTESYIYVTVDADAEPRLMEVIEQGPINVYRDIKVTYGSSIYTTELQRLQNPDYNETPGLSSKPLYYLQRDSEPYPSSLHGQSFEKKCVSYFKDCEALVNRIKKHQYTKDDLLDIIYFYNNYCAG